MSTPYYQDDLVTLHHGDCLEVDTWLQADVLVTDPPYGRGWKSGAGMTNSARGGLGSKAHDGIAGDHSPELRDRAIETWGTRPAVIFGDLLIQQPRGSVQVLIYAKSADAGIRGARAGFRRDAEGIYLVGTWASGVGGRSSILSSRSWVAGPSSPAFIHGHPHAKPLDLLEEILSFCPPGTVADPFAGSGSTLVAAKQLGRKAIGVELEERYCEIAARRLSQGVLHFGEATA